MDTKQHAWACTLRPVTPNRCTRGLGVMLFHAAGVLEKLLQQKTHGPSSSSSLLLVTQSLDKTLMCSKADALADFQRLGAGEIDSGPTSASAMSARLTPA